MATRSQKIKLGIFLAAAGALFALTLLVFAGLAFLSDQHAYHVRFSESVSGLEVGAPVKLRGVRVGSVTGIQLDPEDVELVRVSLAIDAEAPVQTDAVALMMMQGITGLRFVEIQDGTGAAERLPPGSFIPAGESVFSRLTGSAEDMTVKVEQVLNNLLDLTGPLHRERVEALLDRGELMAENIDALVIELTQVAAQTHQLLRENRGHVRNTLANIDRSSHELAQVAEGAGAVISSVDTAELQATITSLAGTLATFQTLLAGMTRMLDQSSDQVQAAIYNMRLAAESFKQLGDSLQRQPSRLFFDRSPKERDLP